MLLGIGYGDDLEYDRSVWRNWYNINAIDHLPTEQIYSSIASQHNQSVFVRTIGASKRKMEQHLGGQR